MEPRRRDAGRDTQHLGNPAARACAAGGPEGQERSRPFPADSTPAGVTGLFPSLTSDAPPTGDWLWAKGSPPSELVENDHGMSWEHASRQRPNSPAAMRVPYDDRADGPLPFFDLEGSRRVSPPGGRLGTRPQMVVARVADPPGATGPLCHPVALPGAQRPVAQDRDAQDQGDDGQAEPEEEERPRALLA